MDFDDVLTALRGARGNHVEVSLFLTPEGDEMRALVGHFEGDLSRVTENGIRPGEFVLHFRLSESHKSTRGSLRLRRDTFQRAEEGDVGDDPWTLNVWQRGVRVALEMYRSGEFPPDPDEDDLPF